MAKLYFESIDSEKCYTRNHFIELMKENKAESMEAIEANIQHGEDYVWCGMFGEIGMIGEECGKQCDKYDPRNGKNGRCKHSKNCYGHGKEVTIKKKNKDVKEQSKY